MTQYINKAKVVAELKKRNEEAYGNEWGWAVQCATYDEILSFIDTLEVNGSELGTQANNVWHGYDEPMDTNRTMLILSPNGKSSLALWNGKSLSTTTIDGGHNILCNGDKWTYVEDLAQKGE